MRGEFWQKNKMRELPASRFLGSCVRLIYSRLNSLSAISLVNTMIVKCLFALLILCHLPGICSAADNGAADNEAVDNWPQWRGPEGNGVAAESGEYPTDFSAEEHVDWMVELPGRGSSTPAVWGDRIFVTCPNELQDSVVCYDFSGQELWRKHLGNQRAGKHRNGSGSNPSPVTDGKYVVVYYKSGTVACLNFAGKIHWQRNLQELYGKDTLWWDLGTSPVLAAGNAVIAVMQEGESFLIAFDLESGQPAWKQNRKYECEPESDQSYTTPCVVKLDGREVLITWGADHLTGHDAHSGEQLWQCGGFNPGNQGMWRVIASPAVDNEVAIVCYGRGEFLAAVDLRGASGDITASHRLWEKSQIGSDVPTPVVHGQHVVLLTDKGKVFCLDKITGQQLWKESLPKAKDKYYASPVLAGDTLYCAREDGIILTATISNDSKDAGLKNIVVNDMGESTIATPIPIRGKLLVRGEKHLFLISK